MNEHLQSALIFLQNGQPDRAVFELETLIDGNPAKTWQLQKIVNLIRPCQMYRAAEDALQRMLLCR